MQDLMTYSQYADSIGRSVQRVYRYVEKGQLKPVIIAGNRFIKKGAVPIKLKSGRPKNKKVK